MAHGTTAVYTDHGTLMGVTMQELLFEVPVEVQRLSALALMPDPEESSSEKGEDPNQLHFQLDD